MKHETRGRVSVMELIENFSLMARNRYGTMVVNT
jgi:hypothetical protein